MGKTQRQTTAPTQQQTARQQAAATGTTNSATSYQQAEQAAAAATALQAGEQAGTLVSVFLTTAVRTSAGPGPGHRQLPATEAGRLVGERYAVYGSTAPDSATHLPAGLS
jgi:hypothetical protein